MGVSLNRWWVIAGFVAAAAAGIVAYFATSPAGAQVPTAQVTVGSQLGGTDQEGYDSGSLFTISVTCDTISPPAFLQAAGDVSAPFDVPVGETCSAVATAFPDPLGDDDFEWEAPVTDTGQVGEQGLLLTVQHILTGKGTVEVTKELSGAEEGYVPQSTFDVVLTCTRGQEETIINVPPLVAGGTASVKAKKDSVCVPTEPGIPEPVEGFAYGEPSFDPVEVTVVKGQTVSITVTNPLTELGSITVIKETEPDGSEQVFEFAATYSDGGFSLSDGQSNESGFLEPEAYDVTEVVPEGWELTSVVCDAEEQTPLDTGVTIFLSPGEQVTCTFNNTAVTGTIVVDKVTAPEGSTQEFDFTLDGELIDPVSFALTDGSDPFVSAGLEPGTYSVEESVPEGWVLTSATCTGASNRDVDPQAIDLLAGETVNCVFSNAEEQDLTGAFSVTKTISGDTEGYVGGEFGFVAQCGDSEVSFALEPDQTFTSEALPVGTECVIVEVLALLPELAEGFVFGVITFDPDQTVTIAADSVSPVTVDNPILEQGRLTIRKTLSGFAEGYDPATSFTVTVDCDDDSVDQSVQVTPTQSATIVGIPFGTECTLTETLPAPLPGFIYGTPSFDPSNTVSITTENPDVTVTIDNPLDPPGFIDVTKRVSGGTAPAGSSFGFRLDCDNDAFDQTFTLTPDATVRLGPIAEFTVCTVVETLVPAGFGTPSFSPSATVTVPPNGVVAVTVTNPMTAIAFTGSSALLPVGLAFVLIGSGIVLMAYGPLRRRPLRAD